MFPRSAGDQWNYPNYVLCGRIRLPPAIYEQCGRSSAAEELPNYDDEVSPRRLLPKHRAVQDPNLIIR